MKKGYCSLFLILLLITLPDCAESDSDFLTEMVANEHLLGDMNKGRRWLEDHGLTFDLIYTAEGFLNTHGGMNTHDSDEYKGDVSLYIELNTSKAGWWENGTFFVLLQESHGHGITEDHVGDFQVLSNIDADDFKQVSEFWYKHSFFEDKFWIKAGKQDANEDFAGNIYGLEFINSSAACSPTIPIVTFPDQDWGVALGINPNEWFSLNAGIYHGRPDGGRSIRHTYENIYGPLVLVEPIFISDIGGRKSRFHVGGWWNGDRTENLDPDEDNEDSFTFKENYGWYLSWDLDLWVEKSKDDGSFQGAGLFMQYGWAKDDRNEAEAYYGGGVSWKGAIPARDEDVFGLGAFNVVFSDKAGFEKEYETAFEFFYKAQITGWMNVKADLQYIANPGGTENEDAVAATGARIEISL